MGKTSMKVTVEPGTTAWDRRGFDPKVWQQRFDQWRAGQIDPVSSATQEGYNGA